MGQVISPAKRVLKTGPSRVPASSLWSFRNMRLLENYAYVLTWNAPPPVVHLNAHPQASRFVAVTHAHTHTRTHAHTHTFAHTHTHTHTFSLSLSFVRPSFLPSFLLSLSLSRSLSPLSLSLFYRSLSFSQSILSLSDHSLVSLSLSLSTYTSLSPFLCSLSVTATKTAG